MRLSLPIALWAIIQVTSPSALADQWVTPDEMKAKEQWVQQTLLSLDRPVMSFCYNGTPSARLLAGWQKRPIEIQHLPDDRTQYTMTWTDPATGLEVRVVAVDYGDYPAVEWTAYLNDKGPTATPIIEQVRGIDSILGNRGQKDAILRTTQGDITTAKSYEPLEFKLDDQAQSFEPNGGRPTNGAWPYFNIDFGRSGVIVAVGWPGQWQAQFSREAHSISVRAGQETTHLKLEPGEEIRTPLTALLFWSGGDWIAGQNLWRHWFLAHNIPRPGGGLPRPMTSICMGLHQSAAGEKGFIDTYLNQGEKIDYWWMDAGWYETKKDWFSATGVGTWKPDPVRFPHGIREVSDYAHSKGMKFVLWFEPERVYRGSFIWDNHPDWLLKWKDKDDICLLNLGNPEARRWITDYISQFITDQGVDLYRQDFNVNPLKAWQNTDTVDRQGMTENLYVQGYLAYWDGLLRQHPGMLIDSCSGGGGRNDLETLRRSVPLLRSDFQAPNSSPANPMPADVFDGNQGHTYGLSLWVPYFGTGVYADDVYSARSHLCPAMGVGTQDLENPNWAAFRRQISDHRAVADYFYGDYYPLTPYSKATDVWMAWEFVRPDLGDGMIQAFRRELNMNVEVRLKLHGLKPEANYEFTDLDTSKTVKATGDALMTDGIKLAAASPRTALILTFKEAP